MVNYFILKASLKSLFTAIGVPISEQVRAFWLVEMKSMDCKALYNQVLLYLQF